jgi:hypothetical protein
MKSSALKPLTSAAIWVRYSDASNRVISDIPDLPAQIADQLSSIPIPTGVINPMPVTTTRLFKGPPYLSGRTMQLADV